MLGRCHIRSEWSRQQHRRADIRLCASASPPINTPHSGHCHSAETSIKQIFRYEPSGISFFFLFLLVLCCATQQCFSEESVWIESVYSQTKVKRIHKTTLAWLTALFLMSATRRHIGDVGGCYGTFMQLLSYFKCVFFSILLCHI